MFATTTTATTQQPSIFKMFYTSKRTKIILEQGWVNAKGVKVAGVKVGNIEKISITCNSVDQETGEITKRFLSCVHVVFTNTSGKRCSTFISCRAFLTKSIEKRREESQKYKAYQNFSDATVWSVYPKPNPNKKVIPSPTQDKAAIPKPPRTVNIGKEFVCCDCEDFEHQGSYLSEHPYLWDKVIRNFSICKHSFTVLNQLGFDSLGKYLKAWQPKGRLHNLGAIMNSTTRRSA